MRWKNLSVIGPAAFLIAASSASEPTSPDEQVVPLYASGPRALAMLTLGDGPPAPVVFDTGTDENILTEDYAKRLGLKVVGKSSITDGATLITTQVPVVGLPKPMLSGVPVTPARAQRVSYVEADMVGVFGPGSFSGKLVTLELARNRLRIMPLTPDTLPSGPSTPYREGLPALNISVAGVPLSAHLDSGSDGDLRLGGALRGKIPLKGPANVIGKATSVSGTQDVYGGQVDGIVRIGPLVLKDPQVSFVGTGKADGANVGYKLLKRLTLVMDPAGQRSWVLDPTDLKGPLDQFAGRFGDRSVRVEGDKFIYQRDGRPPYELTYLGGDLFEAEETGDRLQYRRVGGKIVGFDFITLGGAVVRATI